jgi:hypothetical protein
MVCTEIFGKECEFKECATNWSLPVGAYPGDYYVKCMLTDKEIACLHVLRDFTKTYATVYFGPGKCSDVKHVFTLKLRLKKYKKLNTTVRQKMFKIYGDITKEIGSDRKDITMMISYLTNFEYNNSSSFVSLFMNVFTNWAKNYPADSLRAAHLLSEYFANEAKERGFKESK